MQHDGESGLDYKQVADYVLTLANGLNEPNPLQVNGSGVPIYGNTNFYLHVLGPKGSKDENASLFNIYAIDSNSYSTDPTYGGYDWVHKGEKRGVRRWRGAFPFHSSFAIQLRAEHSA